MRESLSIAFLIFYLTFVYSQTPAQVLNNFCPCQRQSLCRNVFGAAGTQGGFADILKVNWELFHNHCLMAISFLKLGIFFFTNCRISYSLLSFNSLFTHLRLNSCSQGCGSRLILTGSGPGSNPSGQIGSGSRRLCLKNFPSTLLVLIRNCLFQLLTVLSHKF